MAPDFLVIVNTRRIPVVIPSPDPKYIPLVIAPGEARPVDADPSWATKICQQIKGLVLSELG
jgi:hypothetical protein